MPRTHTPSFITEIPLAADSHQARVLAVRFDAARMVYNACLGECLKRLDLLRQSKLFWRARKLPKTTPQQQKARAAAFRAANEAVGFQEYAIHAWTKGLVHSWLGAHLDANTVQTLATRAFRAVQQHAFGKRGRPHFQRKGDLDSVEGKTNAQGIRWVGERLVWGDLQVPGRIDPRDPVQTHGLHSWIKYVRIVRRTLNGRVRYYAQLVGEGIPYRKPQNFVGQGTIGVDPGARVFACVGDDFAARVDLTAQAQHTAMRRLQRKADRQRRKNNPANFLPDGRIKPGKKVWHDSQRIKQTRRVLAEMQRKAAVTRKTQHGTLANELLRRGDVIRIERNSYKSFQRNFGKSVGSVAPSAFVDLLQRKGAAVGATVVEIPASLCLSQVCHACGSKVKKPLSVRMHVCPPPCGIGPVQRDIYSAFLARGVTLVSTESQDSLWQLDAARLETAWASLESGLLAASGLLSIAEFARLATVQPARRSPTGTNRLPSQDGGTELVAFAGVPGGSEASDAVRRGGLRPNRAESRRKLLHRSHEPPLL